MIAIDVGLIVACISIMGAAFTLIRLVMRLNSRLEALERHDRKDYEARCVLLKGVTAALDGLHQLGANGEVSAAEKELKEFVIKR